MSRPFSAYSVLELEPGADRAAVEAAYRRLIKLHHPDRSGGDGQRAAEINRAYFELRSLPIPPAPPMPRPHKSRPRHRRRSRKLRWLLVPLALAPLALLRGDLAEQIPPWDWDAAMASAPVRVRPAVSSASALDAPLERGLIQGSVDSAVKLIQIGDEAAMADQSRDCHREMRSRPRIAQLDRCAAFDTAVAALEDRDPDHDRGPFNASSVTARQMTAASLLSSDYLAIERRLNQIRIEVEMALTPPQAPPEVMPETPENIAVELEP